MHFHMMRKPEFGEPFIKTKEDLKRFLDIESKNYGRKNARLPLFCFGESSNLWKHNYLLRKSEYYLNTDRMVMYMFYKYRLRRLQFKHCISISPNTFDCGLKLVHLGTIRVSYKSRIGKNCSIHINTGVVAGGNNHSVPKLGDNIVIGMGAILLGDISIANGIAIGANALVNKSFYEENIAIAGVPAKKISNNGTNTWNK